VKIFVPKPHLLSLFFLSSGPNDKMVSNRMYESGSGEFTVEYTPSLTGMQAHLIGAV